MKAKEIARCVVKDLFPPRRYAVCPNVSWALLPWECDVLAVSPAGVVNEIEIKVSVSDLQRDLKKRKWKTPGPWSHVDRYWIAGPLEMQFDMVNFSKAVGGGAGVICVSDSGCVSVVVAAERKRQRTVKIKPEEVHRLASLRFWDRELRSLNAV